VQLAFAIGSASGTSALPGMKDALREARGLRVPGALDDLAVAAASNDIAAVGRTLGPRDVNVFYFTEKTLPKSVVRRPWECSLLDVAVGAGSVEMTKYLLEFHIARATRETLKQSLSTGNSELIKLMRERLPEAELRDRVDMMEVATEFHQREVLNWLLRDATVFELELLWLVALERKLADLLLASCEDGFHPWSYRTREVSLKWRASGELEFVSAPEGFSADGGWLKPRSGDEWSLPPRRSGENGVWAFPDGVKKVDIVCAALPAYVTMIGWSAFCACSGLKRLVMPLGVTTIGWFAFNGCSGLVQLRFPSSVTTIGKCAFKGCSGLEVIQIPSSVTTVGAFAFRDCSGLKQLQTPSAFSSMGGDAFMGVMALEHLTLLGSPLSSAVVASLEGCLSAAADVIGNSLVGLAFGRFTIAAV
jgi:hypothetical protein